MSEYVPYERFKWLKKIDKFDVIPISEKKFDRIFSQS